MAQILAYDLDFDPTVLKQKILEESMWEKSKTLNISSMSVLIS
jgi:hypothetical protein